MKQKRVFEQMLMWLGLGLAVMPFMAVANDGLTRLVMRMDFYRVIQNVIVPTEVRLVGVLLYPLGLRPVVVGEYLAIGAEEKLLVEIAWNCVGWQSLVFFGVTGWMGMQAGKYSLWSKLKVWLIGGLGTVLVNLARMALVVAAAYYVGQNAAMVLHDYGSLILNAGWLGGLWWFSYRFVLEEK